MTIKARLLGHDADLSNLVQIFSTGDPGVGRDQDGYYLTSAELETVGGDGGQLQRVGKQLVERINGVGSMLRRDYEPVKLANRFEDDSSPAGPHHYVLAGDASGRARMHASVLVVGADGSSPAPSAPMGPHYLKLIKGHPEVAEVLKLLGGTLSWVDLYKVYEIVGGHAGKERGLTGKGWTTKAEISAFTASANRPDVSGDGARHARPTGSKTPKQTMELSQGQAFIRNLAKVWMDSLT